MNILSAVYNLLLLVGLSCQQTAADFELTRDGPMVQLNEPSLTHLIKTTDFLLIFFYKYAYIEFPYVLEQLKESTKNLKKKHPRLEAGYLNADVEYGLAFRYDAFSASTLLLRLKGDVFMEYPGHSYMPSDVERWFESVVEAKSEIAEVRSPGELELLMKSEEAVVVYFGAANQNFHLFKKIKRDMMGVRFAFVSDARLATENNAVLSIYVRQVDGSVWKGDFNEAFLDRKVKAFIEDNRNPKIMNITKRGYFDRIYRQGRPAAILFYRQETDANYHFLNAAKIITKNITFALCPLEYVVCQHLATVHKLTEFPIVLLVIQGKLRFLRFENIISTVNLLRLAELISTEGLGQTGALQNVSDFSLKATGGPDGFLHF